MINKVFPYVIALFLMLVGIDVYNGGFHSVKHRMFVDFGEDNHLIGMVFVGLSGYILFQLWRSK